MKNSNLFRSGKHLSVCYFFVFLLSLGVTAVADPAITPGTAESALKYYSDTQKALPGLTLSNGVTSIDDLAQFLGYALSGDQLQKLDPAVLMSPSADSGAGGLGLGINDANGARYRDGDILATRFFAPKIVNISATTPVPGWRKLVRLRSRPNSLAMKDGVESAIVLFNFVVADNETPFTNSSFNTQVMLAAPSFPNRSFWLDFDADRKLTLALNASFDAADLTHLGNHDYFVPDGCNACHGSPGNTRPPMVNYLDTDHWFDRVNDTEDFPGLRARNTPLVFDAGTNDSTQPSFAAAFDVIRRFNEEALRQNNLVHSDSFEAEAARKWFSIHATSDAHVPPIGRALSITNSLPWQALETDALGKLNHYCFRCHGSVYFTVYDRAHVLALAGNIKARLDPNGLQLQVKGFKMPPDRVLDTNEVKFLSDFLEKMK